MLRVGMVCPYSLTLPGGVQGQVLGLARELRGQGVEVRVLGPCDGPPPEPFVTPLGNSLPTAANGSMAPVAPDPAAALRTIRAIADEGFHVLHLHEPIAPGPTLTTLLVHPAPILGTFHLAGESSPYRTFRPVVSWLAERIDLRVAVSEDARAMAHRYLGGEYEVLHNGVELDRYRRAEVLRTSGPTVFFCGRHEPRKGLDVLLAAMGGLGPDVRCWVASDGADTARLRAAYAGDPRIVWLGRVSEETKIDCLASADVFCAPSLGGESFGVVLVESMAAGTPVVASDLPGYRNVAKDGVEALLTPPGDVAALTGALQRVLTDPPLAGRLRENGSRRAQEFSMRELASAYLQRYEALNRDVPLEARYASVPRLFRRMMQPS